MYSPVFSGMEHFHQHFIVLVDVIIVKLIFKIPHAENAKENVASQLTKESIVVTKISLWVSINSPAQSG